MYISSFLYLSSFTVIIFLISSPYIDQIFPKFRPTRVFSYRIGGCRLHLIKDVLPSVAEPIDSFICEPKVLIMEWYVINI